MTTKVPDARRGIVTSPTTPPISVVIHDEAINGKTNDGQQTANPAKSGGYRAGLQRVTARMFGRSTPRPCGSIGGEAMLKACGVGMAILPE
jgi:hypothetical protein